MSSSWSIIIGSIIITYNNNNINNSKKNMCSARKEDRQDHGGDMSDIPDRVTCRSVEEKAVPTRAQQLKRLASGEEFDVLVVGGGATGAWMAAMG